MPGTIKGPPAPVLQLFCSHNLPSCLRRSSFFFQVAIRLRYITWGKLSGVAEEPVIWLQLYNTMAV